MSGPKLISAAKVPGSLEEVQRASMHENRRIAGLDSSIVVLEQHRRLWSLNPYRRLSVQWFKVHLSGVIWKGLDLCIRLIERISAVWAKTLRSGLDSSQQWWESWGHWRVRSQRVSFRDALEALHHTRHAASVIVKEAEQGEPVSAQLERLPQALKSGILSFLTPQEQSSLMACSRSLDQLAPVVKHVVMSLRAFLSTGKCFEKTQALSIHLMSSLTRDVMSIDGDLFFNKIETHFRNIKLLSLSLYRPYKQAGLLELSDQGGEEDQKVQTGHCLTYAVFDNFFSLHGGIFKSMMDRFHRLSVVRFSSCIGGEDQKIQPLLQYEKRIKALHLEYGGILEPHLQDVMHGCTHLKELHLNENERYVCLALNSIASQLTTLYIAKWRTPLSALIEQCRGQKQLKRLCIGTVLLNDPTAPQVLPVSLEMPDQEESLSSLSDSDLRAIARFLPQLEELILNCTYTKLSVTEEGLKALAKGCRHLRHLKLFGFEFSDRSLQALATHCPQLSSIWSEPDKVEWRRNASSEVGALEG